MLRFLGIERGGAFLDFFGRHVFEVRGDPPAVAGGVFHAGVAVAVEHVGGFDFGGCAGGEGLFVGGVAVGDVVVEHHGERLPGGLGLADHQERVGDHHLRVQDGAVGAGDFFAHFAAEAVDQEIDEFVDVGDEQIRRDGVAVGGDVAGGFGHVRHRSVCWRVQRARLVESQFTISRGGLAWKEALRETIDFHKLDKGYVAMPDEPRSLNFIEEIIEEHARSGRFGGRVQTRFPPEPNGYLHIGHAKSICLNFGLAMKYGGVCNLRFDDTNPIKEEEEYVQSIEEDVRWLGFDVPEALYASDYFEQIHAWAIGLVKAGHAYVCDLNADQIREYRGHADDAGEE